MLEKTLYSSDKEMSYRDGFVKNGNERCGHTECCDIKRGLVMAMGQAVSRPCIEHTIYYYYYYYKSTDGLDCSKEYTLSSDSLVNSCENHGCSVVRPLYGSEEKTLLTLHFLYGKVSLRFCSTSNYASWAVI